LAVYDNEFILKSAFVGSKITETTKSLKICYIFNTNYIHFKIVLWRTEIAHQQGVGRFGSRVIKRAVGKLRQHPPLAFVLKEDILAHTGIKNNVM